MTGFSFVPNSSRLRTCLLSLLMAASHANSGSLENADDDEARAIHSVPESGPESDNGLADFADSSNGIWCAEPEQVQWPDVNELIVDSWDPTQLAGRQEYDEFSIVFPTPGHSGESGEIRVVVSAEQTKPTAKRVSRLKNFGGTAIDFRADQEVSAKVSPGEVIFGTGDRPVEDFEVRMTYTRGPEKRLEIAQYELVETVTGRTAASAAGPGVALDAGLTNQFGSDCPDVALSRFGRPFPPGMPALHWPEVVGCDDARCADLLEQWIHLHFAVWYAKQVFDWLDHTHPDDKRAYFWRQNAFDAAGDPVPDTSLAHWFGTYERDRYRAVRKVIHDYARIMRTAKTGSIRLKLACAGFATDPFNVCSAQDEGIGAQHFVKGLIVFCERTFETHQGSPRLDSCRPGKPRLTSAMHHEPLHHVFTRINGGLRPLRDRVSHWHGSLCGSERVTGPVYCDDSRGRRDVRHFVDFGEKCWHPDKLVQIIDAYRLYIQTLGQGVLRGEIKGWPHNPADPTPVPPTCLGDPGCLCQPTDGSPPPDGDFSSSQFCPDNSSDSPSVCMGTKFSAGSTVGICTVCDELRGPGCPCNDMNMPCDSGVCWGDDTGSTLAGVGTCYKQPPPNWGCLADCTVLYGEGAYCLSDHPDHARCVPAGVTRPEASNCWITGGHIGFDTLGCVTQPQCVSSNDCRSLGYPVYFQCDQSLRCVPNP